MQTSPLPLSVVVITRNAVTQLRACLESVSFAGECLIVDCGSEDDTVALAETLGARVIHQEWLGFGRQKQFAVDQAQNDWVLCLDADERVSPQLAAGITALAGQMRNDSAQDALNPADGGHQAYRFPRCNFFIDRYLRHGEGYPDWSLRLFNRRYARWSDDPVHEKVIVDRARTSIGTLRGDLLHDSAETLQAYLDKQNRYTTLAAQAAFERGERASFSRLLLSPVYRFVKFYFLRCGFLDGLSGFVHICIGCFNGFSKYAKMIALQKRPPFQ